MTLVLFDIDNFKRVNESHGHIAGDQVLRDICRKMKSAARGGETLARISGEEFCVILPNCNLAQGIKAAERFCTAISRIGGLFQDGTKAHITASAGVASTSDDYSGTEWDLYAVAEKAMNKAKENGGDKVAHI